MKRKMLHFLQSLQIPLYSQTNENENVYILDKGNEVVKSGKIAFPKFKEIKKLLVYNLINEKLPNRMSRY